MAFMPASSFQSRTIFCGDNVTLLRNMPSGSVDMVYMDPPFNKHAMFRSTNQKAIQTIKHFFLKQQRLYSLFPGVSFQDIFADQKASFRDIWKQDDLEDSAYDRLSAYNKGYLLVCLNSLKKGMLRGGYYYLMYMALRLIELHRLLKATGCLYLHCDPSMSHYLKVVLDGIFGQRNFRNELIWWYSWGYHTHKHWNKKHDVLLYYAKDCNRCFFDGHRVRTPYRAGSLMTQDPQWNKSFHQAGKLPEDVLDIPTINAMSKERIGYPTQKPLTLLERLIKASTNEEDWILDPFCGSATTCLASEYLGRSWIGIDLNPQAYYLMYYRVMMSPKYTAAQKATLVKQLRHEDI